MTPERLEELRTIGGLEPPWAELIATIDQQNEAIDEAVHLLAIPRDDPWMKCTDASGAIAALKAVRSGTFESDAEIDRLKRLEKAVADEHIVTTVVAWGCQWPYIEVGYTGILKRYREVLLETAKQPEGKL